MAARSASSPTCRAPSCASAPSPGGEVELDEGEPSASTSTIAPGDATRVQLPHPEIFAALDAGAHAAGQ
jgi:hypothetical protein